jgi:DNA polymerase-3 subunit epsilon
MLLEGPGIARKDSDSANDSVRIIGLGRSIFGIFNENLIRHAIDQITDKLERNYPDVISSFVSQGTGGTLLRVEMVPVLNPGRRYSGLILILHDITQQLDTHNYLNLSLQSLTRGIRASLAGIRSAIENILEYPDMNPTQLETLKQIIHKESLNIGEFLEQDPTLSTTNPMFGQWPLVRITVRNLLELLQARCRESLNVDIRIDNIDSEHFVNVDHYSFLLAMLFVIQQVKTATDVNEFTCRLTELRRFVGIDVLWSGKPLQGDSFRVWEKQPLVFKKEGLSLTLREVIDHHNGELGFYTSKRLKDTSYMRFFLPVVYLVKPEKKRSPTILAASRPEFYDFDLFQQLGQIPELENRKLAELTFTVFDLETTGLHPDEGDEIIAVGAFRIVNCRLLHDECFEQLINPQRSIPWTSVKIHGIHPEMLEGQPTINEVLPRFHDFAKDTILVGHNAAFDMRFLKLKEGKTGVRFTYPVLDTLLLSAAVHPAQEDHNLEAIAQRLGVRILARHTATGDALATGELFLKFLPLLAQKNIYTLKDALAASEKTYYARKGY